MLYLWIAPHVLLSFISVMLYRRKLHKVFTLFFLYTLFETLQFVVLFSLRMVKEYSLAFQYVFIVALGLSAVLRFGVVQEVFNNVFRDYPRLESVATRSMRCLIGVLIIASVAASIYASGTVSQDLMAGVALLDRSVAMVQAALLLFIFVFSWMFGLSWRLFPLGIALGFGILASSDLAVWALRLFNSGLPFVKALNLLLTGSFHVVVLVWLGYLLKAESPIPATAKSIVEINRWTGELERPLQ